MDPQTITHDIIALIALTAMEIVLGIDNIVFISVVTSRLPLEQRPLARRIGLLAAMGTRILLLMTLAWIIHIAKPAFHLDQLGIFADWLRQHKEMDEVTWRDLILLGGGLFLIRSSVLEIHHKVEGKHEEHHLGVPPTFTAVITEIAILDIIFSLDSVITAVGMAESLWVMVTAVIAAVGVMMVFAGKVSRFVEHHPTIKMLALSFLLLIGVMLVAEGIGTHIDKGYIYFAMAFSLLVEILNLRMKAKAAKRSEERAKRESAQQPATKEELKTP
jgi:predicted tellurium resistance membrane protein TerC